MSWVVHYKLAHSLFETDYSVEIMNLKKRFVICLYYTMTTLNTIGYGDFHPQNQIEMVINIAIQIFNALLFGLLTNRLINFFRDNFSWVPEDKRQHRLHHWFKMINRIRLGENNVGVDIPQATKREIEEHFEYFWQYDRVSILF